MNDFITLVQEGYRLIRNLGQLTLDTVESAVLAYFRRVRSWTIRIFVAALAPLLVILPCLLLHLPLSGLYGFYVVWLILLFSAELILITPMFLIWRQIKVMFPSLVSDLTDWLEFIKSVIFNGLALGIFVTLFPIWRSPGAFPLLLLVLASWLTLPACGFSTFCKRVYPTIRAVQLLVLFGLLVLQMAYPRQMEQLSWASGQKIGRLLTSSVSQSEITDKWNTVTWFSNAGEPLVWYSGSESESYRLWGAPGFDPDTGKELVAVRDERTRAKIISNLSAKERARQMQVAAAAAEAARREEARLERERAAAEVAAAERAEVARREEARRQAETARLEGERQAAAKAAAESAELARQEQIRLGAEQARLEKERAEAEKANYLARYLGSVATRKIGAKDVVAVVAVSEDGTPNSPFGNAIVSALKAGSLEATASAFTPEFVADGLFHQAFKDAGTVLKKLELTNSLGTLMLARQLVQYSTNSSLQNIITATMRLELLTVAFADAESGTVLSVAASGVGFKPEDARAQAEERLSSKALSEGHFVKAISNLNRK